MKLKSKMIVLLLIAFAIFLVVPNMVNATTVQYTRTIPSNEGTIKLNFTGLELDATKAYEFALVRQGGTPANWFNIDDGYTGTNASITLSSATTAITDVLKATDIGFIYIREKDNTTAPYILQAYQVNLKLPYLQSLVYTKDNNYYNVGERIYGEIGDYTFNPHTYICWQKVTDENFISEFLRVTKTNGESVTVLENSLPECPNQGYALESRTKYSDKNDGLYLLWVKRTGENCKDVYSCIVHDGLPEATTIEQYIQNADLDAPRMEGLRIQFSSSFEYNESTGYQFVSPGTTITIKATFDEVIYGNTAPTLKIKCGNGQEITVPAGTITGQYILYNYTIKEQDKGIIAAVSMTGGDIKDGDGNLVTSYTCPTLYTDYMSSLKTDKLVFANGTGSNQEDNQNGEWTDFSRAKFELKKNGTSRAILEITGVNPKEGSTYYLFINSNSNKPNVTSENENKIYLSYNTDSKKFTVTGMEKYVELNKDMYVTILEYKTSQSEKVVLYGEKLQRYAEPKYSDAFFATFMSSHSDQIVTTFTHSNENNRKIKIKIGKITDLSILQKIKNQDASGFADLLSFAKSNKGIYDKLVDANKNYYSIAYDAGDGEDFGNSVIDLKGLQNEAYYFLYVEAYDEDGKYIAQEGVTLAQADVLSDSWYLFFYGDEDFEWADFGNVDNSKAPGKLPDTGKFTIISILAVTTVAGAVSFIKTKKYKGI